jgi:hypothetical protein
MARQAHFFPAISDNFPLDSAKKGEIDAKNALQKS